MFSPTNNEFPKTIPIFPLSGVLLLPGGQLPLNVFEPRYLAMTDHVLGHGRFLGMIQYRSAEVELERNPKELYSIGCLGRVSTFAELEDGRYIITLSGLVRFEIIEEIVTDCKWRSVEVSYKAFDSNLETGKVKNFSRKRFVDILQAYFSMHNITGSLESIDKIDEVTLITSVAMAVPLTPQEKQAILECESIFERAQLLQSLMEMAVHEGENRGGKLQH